MKISTRYRYGTRLMLNLALHYGKRPVFLRDIAKTEEISEKYLSQIIIPLRRAGLINSVRGAHGGYTLARSPSQINLKDIVEALEGEIALVECVKDISSCKRSSICVTQEVWDKVGKGIEQTLKAVSLQNLINKFNEKNQQQIMYTI